MMGPDAVQALLDQGETGLKNFARLLGIYRRALIEQGATRAEAQELVLAAQQTYLKPAAQQPTGPEEPEA